MKITSARIYALHIPFVEPFRHSLSERDHSDSIVVKVTTESGIAGFGEGVPRPYVTGETRETSLRHIRKELLPRVMGAEWGAVAPAQVLSHVSGLLSEPAAEGGVVWNASRCAVELAIVDALLRSSGISLAVILPPAERNVTYSAVITGGTVASAEKVAMQCKAAGFRHIKVKVCGMEDVRRVAAVRHIVGPSVTIRLDANAAFNPATALQFLESVAPYDVECIEQPIPRGAPAELRALRAAAPIPVMADESIVTLRDAQALIEEGAVDYFNLRLSKCGGLHNTMALAALARSAGMGIQLGCQVGETAILSAAGRHMAAHLGELRFVEGSYSTRLLVEDISEESVLFGHGGIAPLLGGAGLGITVREELLEKYAADRIDVL